jgi:predicted Ser/Thr protein kinase
LSIGGKMLCSIYCPDITSSMFVLENEVKVLGILEPIKFNPEHLFKGRKIKMIENRVF